MKSKILIEIFVPAGKCSCSYSKWIEKIWDKLDEFREFVDVETTDTNSKRARDLNIKAQTLLIDGKKISIIQLQKRLEELIKLEVKC